jgi:hypothetical protein
LRQLLLVAALFLSAAPLVGCTARTPIPNQYAAASCLRNALANSGKVINPKVVASKNVLIITFDFKYQNGEVASGRILIEQDSSDSSSVHYFRFFDFPTASGIDDYLKAACPAVPDQTLEI